MEKKSVSKNEKVKEVKKTVSKKKEIKKEKIKERKNIFKDMNKEKLKKYSIISGIVLLVIIAIVILVIYIDSLKYEPYYKYEEKMEIYGFSKLYNNGTANTKDIVTISEALKLAYCASFNQDELYSVDEDNYLNERYINLFKNQNMLDFEVTEENSEDRIKYIDVISVFGKCKNKFLDDDSVKTLYTEIKDIEQYDTSQTRYIKELVSNEVIEVYGNKIDGNNYIFKGQLNEIIVNFVEKFNVICMEGKQLNINPDKLPSNYQDYPYITTDIPKEVYELNPVDKNENPMAETAIELYANKKTSYSQMEMRIIEYYDTILNIDYRTITSEDFKSRLDQYIPFEEEQENIDKYVDYVKTNEIILKGSITPYLPILFSDGIYYKLRIKVEFEVVNSKTKNNLLYYDVRDGYPYNYEYADTKYEFYADQKLQEVYTSEDHCISDTLLYEAIIEKDKVNITENLMDGIEPFKVEEEDIEMDGEIEIYE